GLGLHEGELCGFASLVGCRLGRRLRTAEDARLGLLRTDAPGDGLRGLPDVVARDGVAHGSSQLPPEIPYLTELAAECRAQRLHRKVAAEGRCHVLAQGLRQIS